MLGSVRCIQTLFAVPLWAVTLRSDDPIPLLLLTRLTPDSSDAWTIEQGNAFEAEVVKGVEDAGDADEGEVHTHEVPQDDVPGEYLDKNQWVSGSYRAPPAPATLAGDG
jgi:hypothetical protein